MKTIKALILVLLFTGVNYLYAQTARLQVIHNAADAAAGTVDIYLMDDTHGELIKLDDFGFRNASPFAPRVLFWLDVWCWWWFFFLLLPLFAFVVF